MTDNISTPQLEMWRGTFGNEYITRNEASAEDLRIRLRYWGHILALMAGAPPKSILEVGTNIGNNFRGLRLLTDATLHALEPNPVARKRVLDDKIAAPEHIYDGTAQKIPLGDASIDFVYTTGVLTHIHPDHLLDACREIHRVSRRYILCSEPYGRKFEPIHYRGHDSAMFRGDYGSFYLDNFPDLTLVSNGFEWQRTTGWEDGTWFLFLKG